MRFKDWTTPFAVLLVSVLLAVPSIAQEGAAERKPGEFSATGQEAFKLSQEGDLAGAAELLEKHRNDPATTAVDLAMLGALYVELSRPADALDVLRPLAEHPAADPALLYNAGRAAVATGDQQLGVRYYERSVELLPLSLAARELGLIYGAANRYPAAYKLLRDWTLRNPNDLEARLAAILAGLQLNRPSEVEPMFKGLPRDNPRVVILLGQYLNQIGDAPGAIAVVETIIDTAPPEMTLDVLRLLGSLYIDIGQSEKAVALLDGQTDQRPRLAMLLAESFERVGQPEKAVSVLEGMAPRVFEPDMPEKPAVELALSYARALQAAGKNEESLRFFKLVTEKEDTNQIAWKGYGDALVALGRRDEAREALMKFRDLSKAQAEVRRNSQARASDPAVRALIDAQQAIEKGELTKALGILRQEINLSPQDVRPRLAEVQVLLGLERSEEAMQSANETVRLFPQNGDALYQRAVLHLQKDDKAAAEQDLKAALTVAPGHTAAMNDLAVLLMLQGERGQARQLLEKVLELRPDDAMARKNLDALIAREGG